MHSIAAASPSSGIGIWACLAVFATAAGTWVSRSPCRPRSAVPPSSRPGPAEHRGRAHRDGRRQRGRRAAGLPESAGRWGRQLLEHPGPRPEDAEESRRQGRAGPQEAGTRRGVLHAFGGVGRHGHEAQPIPNLELLRRRALVLSVGPAAYGAAKVPTGHHDSSAWGCSSQASQPAPCARWSPCASTADTRLARPPRARRLGRPRR
jgi:hypothetical protein